MRTWLEKKGLIKTKSETKKDELLQMMHDAYGSVANPVWEAWSDSYLHNWLVSHNIIKSDYEKTRDVLIAQMKMYYFDPTEVVWSAWSDSQLKQWLIDHDIVKSDAQASRDKMIKMVEDNYVSAKDTFWSAWSDNSIQQWLVDHGYIRTDAQVKRDELIKLANEKYKDQNARLATYLTWPDARLRAYLREQGVSEDYIPGDRPSLLHETRIRWIQTQNSAEAVFSKIKEVVNSGVYKAEESLHRLYSLLVGGWEGSKNKGAACGDAVKAEWEETKNASEESAEDLLDKAREKIDEKVKVGEEKMKNEL
jgi:cell division septum initiation protein DivIVA